MRGRLGTAVVLTGGLIGVLWFALGREAREKSEAPADTGTERGPEAVIAPPRAQEDPGVRPERTGVASGPAGASSAVAAPPVENLRYRARVVDAGRFPVAGATVELVFPSSGRFRATSDERGEVLLSVPRPAREERGLAHAVHADRAWVESCLLPAAGEPLWDALRPDEIDLGWFPLGETSAVTVRVLREGRPAAGVSVAAEARKLVELARATTDEAGRARFEGLPADWIAFHASTEDADGWTGAILPDPDLGEVEVRLEPLRTLLVRARERKTGRAIEGVRIGVYETCEPPQLPWHEDLHPSARELALDIPETDAEGLTRISGLSRQSSYGVRARPSDEPREHRHQERLARPGQDELAFELAPRSPRTLRWPVVAGELPVPAERTEFELKTLDAGATLLPAPWRGRMEHGELVVEGWWGHASFVFRGPDGALARGGGDFQPVSFFRPRTLEVLARVANGEPAEGLQIWIGGLAFEDRAQARATDAEGRAEFTGLLPGVVEVALPALGLSAGSVDLAEGDGRLDYQLPVAHTIVARMRIGGEPRLPARYWIWSDDPPVRVVREFPERGEIELERTGGKPGTLELQLRAQGFQETSRQVEWAPVEGTLVEFDLEPAFRLVVTALASRPVTLFASCWDEEERAWYQESDILEQPNGPGGTYRFEGLGPGRFRIEDGESGQVSEEVVLDASRPAAHVRFDLAPVVRVTGRVEGPEDLGRRLVTVVAEGEELTTDMEADLAKDGSFTFSLPAGQRVFLTAHHPFLTSADERPVPAVNGAVLHLRAGDEVQIPLTRWAETPSLSSLRILRFAGEPGAEPLATYSVPVVGGVARFGGVPPGRWTFWIDPGNHGAPAVLRDAEIGPGVTRLEERRFEHGSTLRVRVLAKGGRAIPVIQAHARFLGVPDHFRYAQTRPGESLLELSGLASGSYEVTLSSWGRVLDEWDGPRPLEVDGSSDVEWTMELR